MTTATMKSLRMAHAAPQGPTAAAVAAGRGAATARAAAAPLRQTCSTSRPRAGPRWAPGCGRSRTAAARPAATAAATSGSAGGGARARAAAAQDWPAPARCRRAGKEPASAARGPLPTTPAAAMTIGAGPVQQAAAAGRRFQQRLCQHAHRHTRVRAGGRPARQWRPPGGTSAQLRTARPRRAALVAALLMAARPNLPLHPQMQAALAQARVACSAGR